MADQATTTTATPTGNGHAPIVAQQAPTFTPPPTPTKPQEFPEMPYSWNATVLSADGYTEQFTVRGVNHTPFIERVAMMKKFLHDAEYKPAAMRGYAAAATAQSQDTGQPQAQVPNCAIHHTPMSQRQGKNGMFWSCPQKLDDGSWCPYRPKN